MKNCPSCKIKFNTSEEQCPLCQNLLKGHGSNDVFPTNIKFKTDSAIFKTLLFISAVITILSIFIELYFSNSLKYTMLIFGGLISNLFVVYFILKNNQNVLKMVEKYGLLLVMLTLLWYIATKEVIITNYVIPLLCIFELVFILISFMVMKRNYVVNHLSLILLNIFLQFLPILLVLLGWTTYDFLSYISFVCALIIMVGLLIFFHDEIKSELKKIFDI